MTDEVRQPHGMAQNARWQRLLDELAKIAFDASEPMDRRDRAWKALNEATKGSGAAASIQIEAHGQPVFGNHRGGSFMQTSAEYGDGLE